MSVAAAPMTQPISNAAIRMAARPTETGALVRGVVPTPRSGMCVLVPPGLRVVLVEERISGSLDDPEEYLTPHSSRNLLLAGLGVKGLL